MLSLMVCGPLALAAAPWVTAPPPERSGRALECSCWRRLWVPLAPAGAAFAILLGWALQEPDLSDESLQWPVYLWALPVAFVWSRAVVRSIRSALASRPGTVSTAATVGLFRPRAIIPPRLAGTLDPEELRSVTEHEGAHARHRDPLRILLAQLSTDLQWPCAAPVRRLRMWHHALELARDEEARARGVSGSALAAAVVAVTRVGISHGHPCAAFLTGDAEALRERVARLLEPLLPDTPHPPAWARAPLLATAGAGAVATGVLYGDAVVRVLPGVV